MTEDKQPENTSVLSVQDDSSFRDVARLKTWWWPTQAEFGGRLNKYKVLHLSSDRPDARTIALSSEECPSGAPYPHEMWFTEEFIHHHVFEHVVLEGENHPQCVVYPKWQVVVTGEVDSTTEVVKFENEDGQWVWRLDKDYTDLEKNLIRGVWPD